MYIIDSLGVQGIVVYYQGEMGIWVFAKDL